jgi:aryl-alcohol dehydrogenase-like predicted oxidoreductase
MLGLGTGRLASLGAGYSRAQAAECLAAAAESGLNLIDTADSYGSGDCERLLGRLLADLRHPFLLSTKSGYTYCRLPAWLSPLNQVGKKILQKIRSRQCFEPAFIRKNLEHSLRRLRREQVEFFFLHDPTPEALADERLTAELLSAKQAGKVGQVGISLSSWGGTRLPASHPFASLRQTQVNPWMPLAGTAACEVVANHAFGGERIFGESAHLEKIAAQEGMTPRQMLIAYAAQQPGVRSVLVGTGRAEHLRENLKGLGKKLSVTSLASLAALSRSERV